MLVCRHGKTVRWLALISGSPSIMVDMASG